MQKTELTEQLFRYLMSEAEQTEWISFTNYIKACVKKISNNKTTDIITERYLEEMTPYEWVRGYSNEFGFFVILQRERSNEKQIMLLTKDSKEASWYYLKEIFTEIGKKEEISKRSQYELQWHRGTREYDRIKKEWNENPTGWIYDLRYDGRKYWFEYTIHALGHYFPDSRLKEYIEILSKYMNRWFDDEHWIYDDEKEAFVENSHSLEHN